MQSKKKIFGSAFIIIMAGIISISQSQVMSKSSEDSPAGGKMKAGAKSGMMGQMGMNEMGGMMECPMCGNMMDGMGMQGESIVNHYLRHASDLGLSDEQVKKLKDIRTAFQKQAIELRAKIQTGMIDIRDLMDNDTVDMGAVEKQVRANESARTDLILATLKMHVDARNILTPVQRKEAEKFQGMMEMQGRQKGMMGMPGMQKKK
jgi:Spy/CpxP family protein refolding chaperone